MSWLQNKAFGLIKVTGKFSTSNDLERPRAHLNLFLVETVTLPSQGQSIIPTNNTLHEMPFAICTLILGKYSSTPFLGNRFFLPDVCVVAPVSMTPSLVADNPNEEILALNIKDVHVPD
jgi:hypothetical protein